MRALTFGLQFARIVESNIFLYVAISSEARERVCVFESERPSAHTSSTHARASECRVAPPLLHRMKFSLFVAALCVATARSQEFCFVPPRWVIFDNFDFGIRGYYFRFLAFFGWEICLHVGHILFLALEQSY